VVAVAEHCDPGCSGGVGRMYAVWSEDYNHLFAILRDEQDAITCARRANIILLTETVIVRIRFEESFEESREYISDLALKLL